MSEMHSSHSAYREMIVEHLLLGELLRCLWNRGQHAAVLKAAVDDSGYDLVVDSAGVTRYLQLKSMKVGGKARSFTIARNFAEKPGACVIVTVITEALRLDHFRVHEPNETIMDSLKFAKHTRPNALGEKGERVRHRSLPLSKLRRLDSVDELVDLLFPSRDVSMRDE